ncbi:thioester domain-containing protein [Aeromicrobium duanguangcaii]|uniref:Thioester domain-containing protein n=1 Tax=Aeromicrobium duanguangcaii TaxID=2968086 RepID=A0ABY5KA14_9ACTN|nr:thioester domain-containing protein [Aeromicrobium duanguangcaii]MCD9152845.1 thioester domain-containing protein [Aeromicrobium duanguangcaii]UUI67175.1 thioester domain-containing protein [Aeromicrobium duanguangcaii]
MAHIGTTSNATTRLARLLAALLLLGGVLFTAWPAHAEPIVGGEDDPFPAGLPFTELQVGPITGALGVRNVSAYNAPTTFDPVATAYPSTRPAGSTTNTVRYAGAIPASDAAGTEVLTYCIDLFTSTEAGVTYERGDWTEANVRNLGYVGYILQNYYPTTDAPTGVANNVKAAAVQAAIWYFSDNLVLNSTANPQLFSLTQAIVEDARANGPTTEPTQPNLSVSPESAVSPASGELAGPFTVTADGPATLVVEGVQVYADAAGTQPLAEGATVQPGTQLWARATGLGSSQGFSLRRPETVQESTVYLYDGQTPGRTSGQKLILAQEESIEAVASVRITREAPGGIAVTKTITGDGAGLQGAVVIDVECTAPVEGEPVTRQVTIPAGTTGSQTTTLTGIPAGYSCAITESENGDNASVSVTATTIDPETVTVASGQTSAVAVSNVYDVATGGLQVTKTISGAGAGLQSAVEISVECTSPGTGDPVSRTVTIPAGTTGSQTTPVTGIPAGYSCAITETDNGDNGRVSVTATTIDPATVTIVEDGATPVAVTNEYDIAVGGIEVTKTITGDGAGLQSAVVINVACTLQGSEDIARTVTIPAGATGSQSQTLSGIPAGYSCTITEPENGDNGQVSVTATTIEPGSVTITEDVNAAVAVTNEYAQAVGGLQVTKTITGSGAGLQDAIEVLVSCTPAGGGSAVERTLSIPAGSPAGTVSDTFGGLPAGATCTITEPEDGDNGRVDVTATSIDPETITIVEGTSPSVAVTNEYDATVGGITVTKTISGGGAGLQGPVEILVSCTSPDEGGGTIEQSVTIPAGTGAGDETTTLTGFPAGSTCTITEPQDGDNGLVSLTASSIDPETVTVVENTNEPVAVTNEYARAVGGLQVTKIIGGPAAGEQGEVVLDIDCDDADNAFDQQFTIPAGSLAGGYVETLEGIPAGTNCEVTETATGETDTVVLSTPVTITPGPVTIVEELVGEVVATNTYRTQDQGGDDDNGGGGGGGSDYGGYDDFLASTGGPWGPAWGIGVALLVAGGAALTLHRRRSM